MTRLNMFEGNMEDIKNIQMALVGIKTVSLSPSARRAF